MDKLSRVFNSFSVTRKISSCSIPTFGMFTELKILLLETSPVIHDPIYNFCKKTDEHM